MRDGEKKAYNRGSRRGRYDNLGYEICDRHQVSSLNHPFLSLSSTDRMRHSEIIWECDSMFRKVRSLGRMSVAVF